MIKMQQAAEIVTTNRSFAEFLRKRLLALPALQPAYSARMVALHPGAGKTVMTVRYLISRLEDIPLHESARALVVRETRVLLFARDLPSQSVPERLAGLGVRNPKNIHLIRVTDSKQEKEFIERLFMAVVDDHSERILDAWWEGRNLVIISPYLKRLHIPLSAIPSLRDAGLRERERFEIDEDGAFIYWPKLDLHIGWDQFLQVVDPKSYLRARKEKEQFDAAYGRAICVLRGKKGLRQTDVPGLTARQIGRIERGESGATYKALEKLARAHKMPLNSYLAQLADLLPKGPPEAADADLIAAVGGRLIVVEVKRGAETARSKSRSTCNEWMTALKLTKAEDDLKRSIITHEAFAVVVEPSGIRRTSREATVR